MRLYSANPRPLEVGEGGTARQAIELRSKAQAVRELADRYGRDDRAGGGVYHRDAIAVSICDIDASPAPIDRHAYRTNSDPYGCQIFVRGSVNDQNCII